MRGAVRLSIGLPFHNLLFINLVSIKFKLHNKIFLFCPYATFPPVPYTPYEISVSVVNGAGVGETQTVTEFTVEGGRYMILKCCAIFMWSVRISYELTSNFIQLQCPILVTSLSLELVLPQQMCHGHR